MSCFKLLRLGFRSYLMCVLISNVRVRTFKISVRMYGMCFVFYWCLQ